jgi:hypothetical protein
VGDQTVECHRGVGDSPQVGEGEGGSISEPLATEFVDSGNTAIEPLVADGDTDVGENGVSAGRYNLRPRPERNI